MNERPFRVFIDLVNFDQEIGGIEAEIIKIEQEMAQLKLKQEANRQELDKTKDNVFELRKLVDAHELEMKSLDQQEKEKKVLLDNPANYKEYQSIKIEIDNIHQLQLAQEKEVLDAWDKLEAAQRVAQEKQKEYDQKTQEFSTAEQELEQKLSSMRQDLEARIEQRPEKEKRVPDEWLEKYSVMRARVPDPVVPIVQNSCSSCFYIVTGQEVIRAKRGALVQCKGCYRLLYAPEAMKKPDEA